MERGDPWVRGKCIGRGSFGTVSLAFGRSADGGRRTFAVKSVPLVDRRQRHQHQRGLLPLDSLENEIDILRSLDSPHVVSYLGDSTAGGFRNLHMEYMPGGTLSDLAGRLDELRIRSYTLCVVGALYYLHSVAGVVHSDVKGQNVLLGPAAPGCPAAKLSDFGSASRIDGTSRKIPAGGTPLWMAPEVVRGEGATPASDVWSLGCTVIEMATGSHPWSSRSPSSGTTEYQLLIRIGYGDELPELPPLGSPLSKVGLDFVEKCLRRRPEERWTAEQLLQHPFLADHGAGAGAAIGESPRSTLDWVNKYWEFDDDEQSCDVDDGDDSDGVESGRERLRELGCEVVRYNGGEIVGWDSDGDEDDGDDGWEVVRTFLEPSETEEDRNRSSGGSSGRRRTGELGNLFEDQQAERTSTSIIAVPAGRKESAVEGETQQISSSTVGDVSISGHGVRHPVDITVETGGEGASGRGLSNEMGSCCSVGIGCQQVAVEVRKGGCFEKMEVPFLAADAVAIPLFLTSIVHLTGLYRYSRLLTILNL